MNVIFAFEKYIFVATCLCYTIFDGGGAKLLSYVYFG